MNTYVRSEPEIDAEVRRVVYDHFLLESAPVSKEDLAQHLSLAMETVTASYQRLAVAHILVLQPLSGEVLMAIPFSAVPTPFRVRSGTKEWWANCIWDALGIVAMIHQDAAIQTSCPDCGEALHVAVVSGELSRTEGVVHFAVPASQWWDDIVFT